MWGAVLHGTGRRAQFLLTGIAAAARGTPPAPAAAAPRYALFRGVAVGVALVAVSCGGGGQPPRYPASVEHGFVQGCLNTGGSAQTCQCAIHALEAEFTLDEFRGQEHSLRATGQIPADVLAVIDRHC